MANNIDELRSHLFDTLRALRDPDKPMELDRARAVAHVAGVLIESARVEVEFAKVTGSEVGSQFMLTDESQRMPDGVLQIRRHRIAG